MAELPVDGAPGVHRPRNVDWKRAAALLYGDWGTSKAYVIGLAFVAAGFASFPIILAVCVLTAVVGYCYIIVCTHFPDGGGVYSAARQQSRFLASTGALLLVANFVVTAALSGWAAVSYFGVPTEHAPIATMLLIVIVGAMNFFGPRHSGSASIWLAIPAVIVVVLIILLSAPHLTTAYLEPRHDDLSHTWVAFVGVILALSGVEAVANITGVMKADPDSTADKPKVTRTATKSIVPVAVEVVIGTALLGWAMLSIPKSFAPQLTAHKEDMLRYLADYYGAATIGPGAGAVFGIIVGIVFGLSALQRREHCRRRAYRRDLHDGAGWRDAEAARAPEQTRRTMDSAADRGRYSDSRARGDKGIRRPRRPLRDRCGRRDRRESWRLHVQQAPQPAVLPTRHHRRHLRRALRG
jgi:hypothetical protein